MKLIRFEKRQDADDLKVTRVRDWSICFDYKGEHYLLHGNSEMGEGEWQVLYKRHLNEHGFYKLEEIKTSIEGHEWVVQDYFMEFKEKYPKAQTLIYSHLDMWAFAKHLTKMGFAEGCFEKTVKEEELKKQIKEKDRMIGKLIREREKLAKELEAMMKTDNETISRLKKQMELEDLKKQVENLEEELER